MSKSATQKAHFLTAQRYRICIYTVSFSYDGRHTATSNLRVAQHTKTQLYRKIFNAQRILLPFLEPYGISILYTEHRQNPLR